MLDLFCGAGGSSYGAQLAGAEVACGVDMWDLATATYQDNFPTANVVTRRLGPRSSTEFTRHLGRIDLITASPECTSHTCARGSRERDEESRRTALYVLDFVKRLKPRWIVIENVIQMRSWSGYSKLVSTLKKDYHVNEMVLEAASFGTPQTRRRLFIVCDRERESPEVTGDGPIVPARDIIMWDGPWKSEQLYSNRRALPTLERAERAIAAIGKGEPFLIVYYGSDGAGGWQTLDRPLRTMTTLDRFGLVQWEGRVPTLRMLQVPELQAAMGFGKNYMLRNGSRRDRIKLLGNGVCPLVMAAIVKALTSPSVCRSPRPRSGVYASDA